MTTQQILETYSSILQQNESFGFNKIIRTLLWDITSMLHTLTSFMESSLDKMYTLNGLLNDESVQNIFDMIMPIGWSLLTISIVVVGYKMLSGKELVRSQLLINVILALGMMIVLPWGITKLNDITSNMYQYTKDFDASVNEQGVVTSTSLATSIIQNNTIDIVWMDKANWTLNQGKDGYSNFVTDENINKLNPGEVLKSKPKDGDPDYNLSDKGKKVLKSELVIDGDGKVKLKDIKPAKMLGHEFEWFSEYYFRYTFNFLPMITQLLAVGLALFLTGFKVVKLFMEIAMAKIIAPFIATTDLSTGQRIRELIKNILQNYTVLAIIPLVIQLFMVAVTWVSYKDFNVWVEMICIVTMSWFLVDGPEVVKKILGVDLGIQDGWKMVTGAYAATKMATGAYNASADMMKGINKEGKDARDKVAGGLGKMKDLMSTGDDDNESDALSQRAQKYSMNSGAMDNSGLDESHASETLSDKLKDGNLSNADTQNAIRSASTEELSNALNDDSISDTKKRQVVDEFIGNNQSESFSESKQQAIQGILSNDNISDDTKQRMINEITNGNGNVESKQQAIQGILSNDNISDDTKQRMVNEITNGDGNVESKQQAIQGILSNDNISDDTKQRMINEITNGNGNVEQKQRMIQEMLSGQSDAIQNKERMINDLVNNDNSESDKQRMIQEITSGQVDQKDNTRHIQEILSNKDLSNDTKQRMINDIAMSGEQKGHQQMISSIVNGDGNIDNKSQHIQSLLSESTTTPQNTQRMINEITNGDGNVENKQRMINDVMNNSSISDQTKQQLVNSVMNSSSSTPEQKQRMIQEIVNSTGQTNETMNRMIQDIATGTATNQDKKQFVEEVVSGSQNSLNQKVQSVKNVMSDSNLSDVAKTQQVNQMINSSNSDPRAQRQIIDTVLNSQDSLSGKTQAINQIVNSANDIGTKQQAINQIVNRNDVPLETKQSYIKQAFSPGENGMSKPQQQQLVKQIVSNTEGQNPNQKVQNLSQMITGSQTNPNARTQMINEVLNPSNKLDNNQRSQIVNQVLSNTDTPITAKKQVIDQVFNNSSKPLSNQQQNVITNMMENSTNTPQQKQQFIQEVMNKAKPVSNSRNEFINQIKSSSGLNNDTKQQVIEQITRSKSISNPETLTQTVNQVINSDLNHNIKNNIVNELSNAGSVYKTNKESYDERLMNFDFSDI